MIIRIPRKLLGPVIVRLLLTLISVSDMQGRAWAGTPGSSCDDALPVVCGDHFSSSNPIPGVQVSILSCGTDGLIGRWIVFDAPVGHWTQVEVTDTIPDSTVGIQFFASCDDKLPLDTVKRTSGHATLRHINATETPESILALITSPLLDDHPDIRIKCPPGGTCADPVACVNGDAFGASNPILATGAEALSCVPPQTQVVSRWLQIDVPDNTPVTVAVADPAAIGNVGVGLYSDCNAELIAPVWQAGAVSASYLNTTGGTKTVYALVDSQPAAAHPSIVVSFSPSTIDGWACVEPQAVGSEENFTTITVPIASADAAPQFAGSDVAGRWFSRSLAPGVTLEIEAKSSADLAIAFYEACGGASVKSEYAAGELSSSFKNSSLTETRDFIALVNSRRSVEPPDVLCRIILPPPPKILSITRAGSSPTNTSTVTFTATFDGPVIGVHAGNFALGCSGVSGHVGAPTGSGETWNIPVTQVSGDGTLGLNLVDPTGITGFAGNELTDTLNGQQYIIDQTAPTVQSITRLDSSPTNATTVRYAISFSEPITGLTSANLTLNGHGVTGNIQQPTGSGTDWQVTVSSVSGSGILSLNVSNTAGIRDPVGNELGKTFNGPSYELDQTAPVVSSIHKLDANPTNATTVHYSVGFSEPVTGVTSSAFSLSVNGVTAQISSLTGSGASYTVTIGSISGDGTLRLDLSNPSGIRDNVGNNLAAGANGESYTIDHTAPTVTINRGTPSASLTKASSVTYNVVFSEAVNGVAATNFTLSANNLIGTPTIGAPTTIDNVHFTVPVNGIAAVAPSGTLQLNLTANLNNISDLANNHPSSAPGATYTVDQTPPGVLHITSAASSPTNATELLYKIAFTEPILGLTASNLAFVAPGFSGNVGQPLSQDGINWTVSVANISGNGNVRLDVANVVAITDLGGNALSAGAQGPTIQIDQTPPEVSSISVGPAVAIPGTVIDISFTVSEPLSAEPIVGVARGLATLVGHDGNDYSYQYSVVDGDQGILPVIWMTFSDLAGNVTFNQWNEGITITSLGGICDSSIPIESGTFYSLRDSIGRSPYEGDCSSLFAGEGVYYSVTVPAWSRLDSYLWIEDEGGFVSLAVTPDCSTVESCTSDYNSVTNYWENRSGSPVTVKIHAQTESFSAFIYVETTQLPDGTACVIPHSAQCDMVYGAQWYANSAIHRVEGFSFDVAPCAAPPSNVTTPVSRWFSMSIPPQQTLSVEVCDPEFNWAAAAIYDSCGSGSPLACADSGETAGCATVTYANNSDSAVSVKVLATYGPNSLHWTASFSCHELAGASCTSPFAAACGDSIDSSLIPGHQVADSSYWIRWLTMTVPAASTVWVSTDLTEDSYILLHQPNCGNAIAWGRDSVRYDNTTFSPVVIDAEIRSYTEEYPVFSIACEAIPLGGMHDLPINVQCGSTIYQSYGAPRLPMSSSDVASCAYSSPLGNWLRLELPPWQATTVIASDGNIQDVAVEIIPPTGIGACAAVQEAGGAAAAYYANSSDTTTALSILASFSTWAYDAQIQFVCDDIQQTCTTATPFPLTGSYSLGAVGSIIPGNTSDRLACFPSVVNAAGHWLRATVPPRAALTIRLQADTGTPVGIGWVKDGQCIAGSAIKDCLCGTTSVTRTLNNASDTTITILALANYVSTASPRITATRAEIPLLVCSWQHVLALKGNGSIYGWGANWTGQLGLGNYTSKLSPVPLSSSIPRPVKDIGAYTYSSAFVGADGLVRTCGNNGLGQLGDLTTSTRNTPVIVKKNDGTTLTQAKLVTMGANQAMAVCGNDNSVWSWGYNNWGQLGDGTQTTRLGAVQVRWADDTPLTGAQAVASGYETNMALLSDGTVRSWGYGNYGANGGGNGSGGAQKHPSTPVLRGDTGSTLMNVIAIATCGQASCALDRDGVMWSWGSSEYGQLGSGNTAYSYWALPVKLDSYTTLTKVVAISAHSQSMYAVTEDGKLYAWGWNGSGQLGLGQAAVGQSFAWPQRVQFPASAGDVRIVSGKVGGQMFGQAIAIDGMRWAWGTNNSVGFLGDGTGQSRYTPSLALPLP